MLRFARAVPLPRSSYSPRRLKRFLSLFLLVSYLLSSPGLVYSLHYCGTTVTGVSLAAAEPASCCGAMKKPAGCCHDQKVQSTIKDAKLTVAQIKLLVPVALPVPPVVRPLFRQALTYPAEAVAIVPVARPAPPPVCPAYVRGHAFRL